MLLKRNKIMSQPKLSRYRTLSRAPTIQGRSQVYQGGCPGTQFRNFFSYRLSIFNIYSPPRFQLRHPYQAKLNLKQTKIYWWNPLNFVLAPPLLPCPRHTHKNNAHGRESEMRCRIGERCGQGLREKVTDQKKEMISGPCYKRIIDV